MHEVTRFSSLFEALKSHTSTRYLVFIPVKTDCLRMFFLSSQLPNRVVLFLQDPSNKIWLVSHAFKVMQPDTLLLELLLKKFHNRSVKYFPLH